jgi:hypothetical protein
MPARKSTHLRNIALAAEAAEYNDGYLRIYSGPQPASTERKATGTLLAELRFQNPAFEEPDDGWMKSHPLIPDPSAAAEDEAGWFRCLKEDGSTVLYDGSCALNGGELTAKSLTITHGMEVSCEGITIKPPPQT